MISLMNTADAATETSNVNTTHIFVKILNCFLLRAYSDYCGPAAGWGSFWLRGIRVRDVSRQARPIRFKCDYHFLPPQVKKK